MSVYALLIYIIIINKLALALHTNFRKVATTYVPFVLGKWTCGKMEPDFKKHVSEVCRG